MVILHTGLTNAEFLKELALRMVGIIISQLFSLLFLGFMIYHLGKI